jgi:hypothetical protein
MQMWSNFDPAVEEAEKAMEKAALAPAVALPTNYSGTSHASPVTFVPPSSFA